MAMHTGRNSWRTLIFTVLLTQLAVHTAFTQERSEVLEQSSSHELTDVELQQRAVRIGQIIVEVDNVFDANDPEENGILYRAANALHIKSRNKTILAELLFKRGDIYSRHTMDESARNLRAHSYLNEADIKPVQYHSDDNTVDVVVRVHDVWTFNPGISYGRSGGANHSGVQLAEGNLLGYGKSLSLQSDRTTDRTQLGASYTDPNLLSSRWQLSTTYIHASDGGTNQFSIAHPFFSLETRWSGALDGLSERRIDKRYQQSAIVDQYQTTHESYGAQYGWSNGLQNGWVRRWFTGYRADHLHYAPDPVLGTLQLPKDQRVAYPWLGLSWLEDRYEVTRNRDQIGRTEDVYYGQAMYIQFGLSAKAFGSDVQSELVQLTLQDAKHLGDEHSLFGSVSLNGIHQDNAWRDSLLVGTLRYDYRPNARRMFTAKLTASYGIHLDPSLPLYLGDDDGLRGYPLHYRSGTHREVLNVEQRFYSTWQIFRLLTVGAAAFVDVGHIGGSNGMSSDGSHVLSDIGVGLRLGSIRSSKGEVFHINASYPLNAAGNARKLQLQVVTKTSF